MFKWLKRWLPLNALLAWFPTWVNVRPTRVIVIAKDYSAFPGARYESQGDNSGQRFAEEILCPAFREAAKRNERLVVDLDGSNGYSCDFLDESFTLLIRHFGMSRVKQTLIIKSNEEPSLIDEIEEYMLAAEYHRCSR